ncbi:Negative growth regulatory protein NGR1 [Nakaseomyces glabratus]|nr:Negative growth regulatory protein NGR1 [Nakaseomyces glabratus]KTB18237.1 Negative growth regulatory protein NGR1 [Nakaseomyces glabratus]
MSATTVTDITGTGTGTGTTGSASTATAIPLPPTSTIQTSDEPPRTLWMGDLDPSYDEETIQEIWSHLGKHVTVKLIRAKKNLLIPCSSTSDPAPVPAASVPSGQNGAQGSGQTGAQTGTQPPQEDTRDSSSNTTGSASNTPASDSGIQTSEGEQSTQQPLKININGVSFIDPATTQLHHAGYCFVEFESQKDAQEGLALNSTPLPNFVSTTTGQDINPTGQRTFRLNWASGATLQSSIPTTPEYSLFVGDLSPTATEADLLSLFQTKFKSVKTVRVMTDPITGASRCFGFVRFGNEEERRRALIEMNGVHFQGRTLRVAYATPRSTTVMHTQGNNPHDHHVDVRNTISKAELEKSNLSQYLMNSSNNSQRANQLRSANKMHNYPNASGFQQTHYSNDINSGNGLQRGPPQRSYNPGQLHYNSYNQPEVNYGTDMSGGYPPNRADLGRKDGMINTSFVNTQVSEAALNDFFATDPTNTTVFVGGLGPTVQEQQLRKIFQPFGNILSIKIPPGKNCGFVKFEHKIDAEAAIQGLQGFVLVENPIRLSWGRNHVAKNMINKLPPQYVSSGNQRQELRPQYQDQSTMLANNNINNQAYTYQHEQFYPSQQQMIYGKTNDFATKPDSLPLLTEVHQQGIQGQPYNQYQQQPLPSQSHQQQSSQQYMQALQRRQQQDLVNQYQYNQMKHMQNTVAQQAGMNVTSTTAWQLSNDIPANSMTNNIVSGADINNDVGNRILEMDAQLHSLNLNPQSAGLNQLPNDNILNSSSPNSARNQINIYGQGDRTMAYPQQVDENSLGMNNVRRPSLTTNNDNFAFT